MAEDDKYVPSEGNRKLDPTARGMASVFRAIESEQKAYEAKRDSERGASVRKGIALSEKQYTPEGYERDSDGILRNRGYESTKGYEAKEYTRQQRAIISERTWGKEERGETMDMYGKRKMIPMRTPQFSAPTKKSDITQSMSPEYGQPKWKTKLYGDFAAPVASGLMPWLSRFNPTVCGPCRVSTFGYHGGVFQSNAQESINGGFPVKMDNTWGNA